MNHSKALILALITQTLSIWSTPTLQPYDANNAQRQQEAIALYKSARGASEKDIPMVLEHNYEEDVLPRASIFVDDNNAIIGLIIYQNLRPQGRPLAAITDFMMDQRHKNQASDLLSAFEHQKRAEHYEQINATIKNNKSILSKAGFKTTSDKYMMAKNISGESSSSSSSSSSKEKCCVQ